jgi:hypothetical protein
MIPKYDEMAEFLPTGGDVFVALPGEEIQMLAGSTVAVDHPKVTEAINEVLRVADAALTKHGVERGRWRVARLSGHEGDGVVVMHAHVGDAQDQAVALLARVFQRKRYLLADVPEMFIAVP